MNVQWISHITSTFDENPCQVPCYDSHKITLHILTTPIDEVIIGSISVQFSADMQPLRLFYWDYLRVRKFLSLK